MSNQKQNLVVVYPLEKVTAIAKHCLQEINQRFPFGGINILKNITTNFKTEADLTKQIKLLEGLGGTPVANHMLPTELKSGYCDQLAHYGFQEIYAKYPDLNIEFIVCKQHILLALNRDVKSDPNNIELFGKNAVLFDPWALRITEPDLPNGFSLQKILKYPNIPIENFSTGETFKEHYMSGVGKIEFQRTGFVKELVKAYNPHMLIANCAVTAEDRPSCSENLFQGIFTKSNTQPVTSSQGVTLETIKIKYNLSDTSQKSLEKAFRNAAVKNHRSDLDFLADKVDINARDEGTHKKTALHWAVIKKNKACITFLLKKDPDLGIRDAKDLTAFDYAKNEPEILALKDQFASTLMVKK